MSVTGTQLCRLVPVEVPVGPDYLGRINTYRFFGTAFLSGDASAGVAQMGFTLPTGSALQGSEWKLDMFDAITDPNPAAIVGGCTIEIRGGEVQGAFPLDWYGIFDIYGSAYNIGVAVRANVPNLPDHPFRLESQNSYIRLTIAHNLATHAYYFKVAGRIFLPVPLSQRT